MAANNFQLPTLVLWPESFHRIYPNSLPKLGVAQIVCGVLAVAFGSLATIADTYLTSSNGTGIWMGSLFVVTGVAGVLSTRSNPFMISTFLTLSIVSCLSSLFLMGLAGSGVTHVIRWRELSPTIRTTCLVADASLALIAMAEGIFATIAIAICCRETCVCCKDLKLNQVVVAYLMPGAARYPPILSASTGPIVFNSSSSQTFIPSSDQSILFTPNIFQPQPPIYELPPAYCTVETRPLSDISLSSNRSQIEPTTRLEGNHPDHLALAK